MSEELKDEHQSSNDGERKPSKREWGCKHEDCSSSSGMGEELTFGRGKLSFYGYWKYPCYECARAFEKMCPEYAPCWPFEEQTFGEEEQMRGDLISVSARRNAIRVGWKNGATWAANQQRVSRKEARAAAVDLVWNYTALRWRQVVANAFLRGALSEARKRARRGG